MRIRALLCVTVKTNLEFRPDKMSVLRTLHGYSLRGLSKVSGVSFSHLAALERGENQPSPSTLRKIAEGLGIEVEELLDLEKAS